METLTVEKQKTQESAEDLIASIGRYVEALIESYPVALSQKELAEKAEVSPSAVSKIKERLYPLCDINILAYNSQFLLSPNFDLFKSVIKEHTESNNLIRALKLLSTEYAEKTVDQIDIHKILVKKAPLMAIFSKEETKMLAKIVMRIFRSIKLPIADEKKMGDIIGVFGESNSDSKQSGFLLGLLLGLRQETNGFDWPIDSEKDILTLITIRDKSFYLLKDLVCNFSEKLSVFETLEEDDKQQYRVVMEKISDHYLKKYFDVFTNSLEADAKKRS